MRVYSWKTLLATVLVGGGMLVWGLITAYQGNWSGAPWAVVSVVWIIRGLRASLTEAGYREDVENGERGRRVYRALFGKLAPAMQNGVVILMLAGLAFAWALPQLPWIAVAFVIGGAVYQVWLYRTVRRALDEEKQPGES